MCLDENELRFAPGGSRLVVAFGSRVWIDCNPLSSIYLRIIAFMHRQNPLCSCWGHNEQVTSLAQGHTLTGTPWGTLESPMNHVSGLWE